MDIMFFFQTNTLHSIAIGKIFTQSNGNADGTFSEKKDSNAQSEKSVWANLFCFCFVASEPFTADNVVTHSWTVKMSGN